MKEEERYKIVKDQLKAWLKGMYECPIVSDYCAGYDAGAVAAAEYAYKLFTGETLC